MDLNGLVSCMRANCYTQRSMGLGTIIYLSHSSNFHSQYNNQRITQKVDQKYEL